MKIPMGDFGFRTGELAPAPNVGPQAFVQPGLDNMGDGLAKLGAAGAEAALAKQHDAFQEQEQKRREAEAAARAEARQLAAEAKHTETIAITGKVQNAMMDTHAALRNGIIDGTVDPNKAGELWTKQSTDALDATLKDVDPQIANRVRAGLVDNVGNLGRDLGQAVTTRRRSDIRANIDSSLEEMDRLWLKDSTAARAQGLLIIDANGPAAGMSPADIQKTKQAFIERGTYNASVAYLNANQNNAKALQTFLKVLPQNEDIDPQKQNILIGQAQNALARLEAKALRAEASRMATVEHTVKALDSMILKGYEPSADQWTAAAKAAKGTPYEAVVSQGIEFSKQTAAFRGAPPLQREKFISELESEVRKTPTPDGIKTLERMKQIDTALTKEVQDNPVQWGMRNGENVKPLDFAKPETIGDQLAARVPFLRGMKAEQRAPMKPVTEQEAQTIADSLKGLQPAQKTLMLQSLTAKIGDMETIKGLASQIAPKDQGLAAGMMLAARGLETTKGRTVAELYFKGQAALHDKTAKIDDKAEIGARATIAKELAGVYATPEGQDLAVHTALGVYAGLKAEGSDNLNRAIALTTGGITTHNGSKIAKPYGYSDSMFNDALAKITADDLKRAAGGEKVRVGKIELTVDDLRKQLPGATLQTVDDGVYAIRSDAGYVRRPDGKTLTIRVR